MLMQWSFYITAPPCPWSSPTSQDFVLKCKDGTFCDTLVNGWTCCNNKGGREKCPKNYPLMCAQPNCAAAGTDYCCVTDCTYFGGVRQCGKFKI